MDIHLDNLYLRTGAVRVKESSCIDMVIVPNKNKQRGQVVTYGLCCTCLALITGNPNPFFFLLFTGHSQGFTLVNA